MKKLFLLLGVTCVAFAMNGCALLSSGYVQGGGFPRTMPAILVAHQDAGGVIAPKMESLKDVEVLGKVSSEVSGSNILMVISEGDLSIAKAKELALKQYPEADDVVNVEIDMSHRGVMCLFNYVTMYYRGLAIKYKK